MTNPTVDQIIDAMSNEDISDDEKISKVINLLSEDEFSKRVGELTKGGNVAWELQKRARQTRNENTRFYNFWRFASY